MRQDVWGSVKVVAAAHGAVLLFLLVPAGCRSMFSRRPDRALPIEFMVEVPAGDDASASARQPAEPTPPAPPDPAPALRLQDKPPSKPTEKKPAPPKETAKKPDPPKPAEKPKIEIGPRVVRRPGMDGRSKTSPLSEAEIRRLMALGAVEGDRTVIPGEDERNLLMIQRALHAAWIQPSRETVGDAVAEATIRLDPGGRIVHYRLSRRSGRPLLDASVLDALKSVESISGLSPRFIGRRPEVTIAFKLE